MTGTPQPINTNPVYIPIMPPDIYLVAYEIHYADGFQTHGIYPTWFPTKASAEQFIAEHCIGHWAGVCDAAIVEENYAPIAYAMPPM